MAGPAKLKTVIKKKSGVTKTKLQMTRTGIKRQPTGIKPTKKGKSVSSSKVGGAPKAPPKAAPPEPQKAPVASQTANNRPAEPVKPKAKVAKLVRAGKNITGQSSRQMPPPVASSEPPKPEPLSLLDENYPIPVNVPQETPVTVNTPAPTHEHSPALKPINKGHDPNINKTGIMQTPGPIKAKAFDKDNFVGIEVETLKDQLQNYLEVCDTISEVNWETKDIIDVVHVMVRSLGMDTVSIFLMSGEDSSKFNPLVSRGYKTPPTAEVILSWQECIVPDAGTINWGKLMRLAEKTDTPLARWIVHEGLNSIGYVPIQDGVKTYGFILVGSYNKHESSPVSSSLLEVCGGRLGLTIKCKTATTTESCDWPETVLETSREIRDQFTLLMGYVELLRESPQVTAEEILSFTESCANALNESIQLLDRMTEEAVNGSSF